MNELHAIHCPYCGEPIDILVDASAGDAQYIEDCSVCCRPIAVELQVDADGSGTVTAARSD
ncbi:MAG TPA: CPXCG motif-containing cysteine-rich protein [Xanthomonadaceae bacterium]|nr:CPXCG motif-containing cysteine-rich protein [Xanthomonadaceae bacterium]